MLSSVESTHPVQKHTTSITTHTAHTTVVTQDARPGHVLQLLWPWLDKILLRLIDRTLQKSSKQRSLSAFGDYPILMHTYAHTVGKAK